MIRADVLPNLPRVVRYGYFVLTTCMQKWKRWNEPNPFVFRSNRKQRYVNKREISRMVEDIDPFEKHQFR